jgi:hypothetical protein
MDRVIITMLILLCTSFLSFAEEGTRTIKVKNVTHEKARFELTDCELFIVNAQGRKKIDAMDLPMEDVDLFLFQDIKDVLGYTYGSCQIIAIGQNGIVFINSTRSPMQIYRLSPNTMTPKLCDSLGLLRVGKPARGTTGSIPSPK